MPPNLKAVQGLNVAGILIIVIEIIILSCFLCWQGRQRNKANDQARLEALTRQNQQLM